MGDFHKIPITRVAATVLELLGLEKDAAMAPALSQVTQAAGSCDRVFLYNPDAIAEWVYQKYCPFFAPLEQRAGLSLPMLSMIPSVTPVCFASMYSGLLPAQHGIQRYVKPVLTVPTIFDRIPEQGRKAAIVSTANDSISLIFLQRNVDYFIYPTVQECNEKAMELIDRDEYDCIVLYNGNYDSVMHRDTPEGPNALAALQENIETWCALYDRIREKWSGHRTALAFAPDHGCHAAEDRPGSHGTAEPCDMNIRHFWAFL